MSPENQETYLQALGLYSSSLEKSKTTRDDKDEATVDTFAAGDVKPAEVEEQGQGAWLCHIQFMVIKW